MVTSMIPLPTAQNPNGLTPAQVAKLQTMPQFNVLWMLARTGWFNEIIALLAVMFKPNDFPQRDRETMVLRISSLLGAGYPIAQHQFFGRTAGLTNEKMEAILRGDTRARSILGPPNSAPSAMRSHRTSLSVRNPSKP